MFCDNCGCEIKPGSKVCPVCGKEVVSAGATNGMMINDISSGIRDARTETPDMQRVVPDLSYVKDTTVVNADAEEEEGTTILRAEEEEEGTTVLNQNPMYPNGPMMGQGQPNGPMMGQGRPNGPMMGQGRPNGPMMGQGQPNGPMMGQGQPNGPMMGQGQPNGPVMESGKPEKKAKAEKKKKETAVKAKPDKKKGKGGKIALLVVLVVILLALGGGAAYFVPKYLNYNKAEEAFDAGKIEEAVSYYGKAGSFKKAKQLANGGAYYEYAKSLAEAGNYIDAASNYEKAAAVEGLDDAYKDAADKAKECYFNQGETLYASANYTEAASYYEKAGDYSGAAEKVKECSYMNGTDYEAQKQYEEAISAYEAAGDYKDAADKIKECYYNNAADQMEAGDYEAAQDLFLKSEYSDYSDKANECLVLLGDQYYKDKNYEKAVSTYEEVDESYKDCTDKMDKAYTKWGSQLYKSKEYKKAVETWEKVSKADVSEKIQKGKKAYIKAHYDSGDETTIGYLCDLRYADYGTAEEDYTKLLGWTVESFVNNGQEDYSTKKKSAKSNKTIYVHTMYSFDGDAAMNLKGYVVYSDGTKSNEVTFGEVKNSYTTWMSIDSNSAIKGNATMYVYNADTNALIEKYTFKIK